MRHRPSTTGTRPDTARRVRLYRKPTRPPVVERLSLAFLLLGRTR